MRLHVCILIILLNYPIVPDNENQIKGSSGTFTFSQKKMSVFLFFTATLY